MFRRGASRGGRRGIAVLAAASLAACGSSEVRGPPIEYPTATVAPGALRLAGLGDLMAVLAPSTAGPIAVRLFRQDGAEPDQLLDLGTVPAGDAAWDLPVPYVGDQWITVAGGGAGAVERVATGGPYGAPSALPIPGPVLRAVAVGGRLVAVGPTSVRLYDLATPASPRLLATFPLPVPSTEVAAAGGGVFVFTTTGYGYLDPVAATWAAFDSPRLGGVTRAQAYGGKLYVFGPSEIAGRFRVARLDPSAPPALRVEIENERIAASDPALAPCDFAYDASTGDYLVLEVPQEPASGAQQPGSQPAGSDARPASLLRFRESGGDLALAGTVLLGPPPLAGVPLAVPPATPYVLHAFRGRAYVVMGGSPSALATYRLP